MPNEKNEPSFEQLLSALEQRVAKMESGELSLEESIREFESGSKLLKLCRSRLDTLEKKIELLTRDDGDAGQWTQFDPSSGARVREEDAPGEATPSAAAEAPVDELPF